ncbi:MAG TPA: PQQ-binding-like beta-propeller repeat protein [Gemmatimonadales bacterium]
MLWTVDGVGMGVEPAMDASTVYFGAQHAVLAVDKRSGRLRWRSSTGESGSIFVMGANVVLADDVVAMGDSWVHGFDRRTGRKLWVYTPSDWHQVGAGFLATDGTRIYAGGSSNRIYAIDAATGQERWATQLPAIGPGEMKSFVGQVRDGMLFVGSKHLDIPVSGALLALDAATGRIVWSHAFEPGFPGAIYGFAGMMAFHGPNVIVGVDDGRIHAIDRATGEPRWTAPWVHPLPPEPRGSYGDWRPLVVAGDIVVAGSTSGVTVGLDARSGAERWRLVEPGIYASAWGASTDGRLAFLHTSGGRIYALDAATGSPEWRVGTGVTGADTPEGERVYHSIALPDADRVYAAGSRGFYALRK